MGRANSSAAVVLLSAAVVLSSISTAAAFNISQILEEYPEYSQFNALLNQTKLVGEINGRQSVTVLAVGNGAIGGISGKPEYVQRKILSTHIVLDYYDETKLNALKKNKTVLTTLFQSTGSASGRQGFLVVVTDQSGTPVFGSAASGSPRDARFMGEVVTRPYNISVLHISQPIIANGIEDGNGAPPPAAHNASSPDASVADGPVAEVPAATDVPATADSPTAEDAPSDDAEESGAAVKGVVSGVVLASFLVTLLLI